MHPTSDMLETESGEHPRTSPLVSVVIPACNRLSYLRAAIDSVLEQTYENWELVVADDGSAQATREYLSWIASLPRARVVWLEHSGIPAIVRNAAIAGATGTYVAFLDSDDLWHPRKLEYQLDLLQRRPECLWSYTAFVNVDQDGRILPEEARRRWMACEGDIFVKMTRGEVSIRTPTVLVSRRLLLEVGAFDESMRSAEDYDLWFRLALRSPVALHPEPLVHVRSHGENHSSDWSSAYAGQDRTFKQLQRAVGSDRRNLLRQARANNALRLAYQYVIRGNRGNALRVLLRSTVFSWRCADWRLKAPKLLLRTMIPEWLLAVRRRRRHPV
jgi:glycosyltransferase involved in cell wall biosynthesis